jgi:hypothetical protein
MNRTEKPADRAQGRHSDEHAEWLFVLDLGVSRTQRETPRTPGADSPQGRAFVSLP